MAGSWTKSNLPKSFTTDELTGDMSSFTNFPTAKNVEGIIRHKTTDSLPNFGLITRVQWPPFKEGDPSKTLLNSIVKDDKGISKYSIDNIQWVCCFHEIQDPNSHINTQIVNVSKSKIPSHYGNVRHVITYVLGNNYSINNYLTLPRITLNYVDGR